MLWIRELVIFSPADPSTLLHPTLHQETDLHQLYQQTEANAP